MEPEMTGPTIGDAFGQALLAALDGEPFGVVHERDDGLVGADSNDYFKTLDEWHERDRWCLDQATGRVVDVGAGGGRASLALQDRGQEVTALDVSPGVIEVCRRRGVRDTFLGDIRELATESSRKFDSFLAMGNNLGLLGNPTLAAEMFDAFTALANPGAKIIGTCGDPASETAPPRHAAYHERNRQAGRMPGQVRLRTRVENTTTEWFDLLLMSPEDLDKLARASGWELVDTYPGQFYGAVLRRVTERAG